MGEVWLMGGGRDMCGHTPGISTDEMRLRNYIRKDEMPYTTPNGCVYDSGDYAGMLALAKKLVGWDDWKKKQAAARKEGRWIGIGIGSTPHSGTNNFGQARIFNNYAPLSAQSTPPTPNPDFYRPPPPT